MVSSLSTLTHQQYLESFSNVRAHSRRGQILWLIGGLASLGRLASGGWVGPKGKGEQRILILRPHLDALVLCHCLPVSAPCRTVSPSLCLCFLSPSPLCVKTTVHMHTDMRIAHTYCTHAYCPLGVGRPFCLRVSDL